MMKLMRENKYFAIILAVVRVILGYKWIAGGWGKITGDTAFDASGYLMNAITNPVAKGGEAIYPTYNAFIEHIALPFIDVINVLVPWGEFLIGLGLILGILTLPALFFGLLMNFMFLFAGTISTNPQMVLLGIILLLGATNTGKFGGDYFLNPWLKENVGKKLATKFKRA